MTYVRQFLIIVAVSFVGEILHFFIPLPIPASIYGLVLMLTGLCCGVIKLRHVRKTAGFLIDIMTIMFIPAAVGLMEDWVSMKEILVPFLIICVGVTFVVMVVTGGVTQFVIRKEEKR